MSANSVAPGTLQKRFAAYLDRLAQAAGHADRAAPLRSYCTGLLLPGDRKSVEPMAARLAPDNVRQTHQSLHHVVAQAPWSDEAVLQAVRSYVLPALQKKEPLRAWIVDDTGYIKKGTHSVGVARQYCGQVGKQENCQVAVSLSISTGQASLPVAWRLYLPKVWAQDQARRAAAGVPEEIQFATKGALALEQIRAALAQGIPTAPVLADPGYGNDTQFRQDITGLGLLYVMGVNSSISVWPPGQQPLPKLPGHGGYKRGQPPKRLRRSPLHAPVSVKELALGLPASAWHKVSWREGSRRRPLSSRFAAVRIRPAHRDYKRTQPYPEEWLLIEWPQQENAPTKYWLSTLPGTTGLRALVLLAKHRWIIERDYEELKQELGLDHYEGRGWRGFHHHAILCIAAYGFLVAERSRFSPSARAGQLGLPSGKTPPQFRPRGASRTRGTA